MQHHIFKGTALFLVLVFLCSIKTYATDYSFDADYYARRYPDVVTVLGNNTETLYNHYLNYGIYEGRYVSQDEETYYFKQGTIKPCKEREITPVEIIPLYDTYIDVDIDSQTVTYFEDGVIKLQSPCVTGKYNSKYSTPTGEFSIKCKTRGKRLIGPTWNCWVNRWMRFTDIATACGFHDASWRSEFGGEIYKTDGSHGCVNLPKEFAKSLFEAVEVGTKVVIH